MEIFHTWMKFLKLLTRHNLEIIEDACQSLGTTYKKKQSGTFSKMGCFSMYAAKVMTLEKVEP